MAVGNLLNNALLLGNSSNSTRQSGGTTGVDLCTVHAHTHVITRKPRAPKPMLSEEGRSGGFPG